MPARSSERVVDSMKQGIRFIGSHEGMKGIIVLAFLITFLGFQSIAFLPVFWAIPTEILSDSKAAVAVGTINALASLAGFAGPYAFGYLRAETGSFVAGFVVLMSCVFAAGIFVLLTPAAQSRGPKPVTSS